MRTFSNFPKDSICPLCNTNDDKECCLIPIDKTGDGRICEAIPVHLMCLIDIKMFRYNYENNVIYKLCVTQV